MFFYIKNKDCLEDSIMYVSVLFIVSKDNSYTIAIIIVRKCFNNKCNIFNVHVVYRRSDFANELCH